MSMLCCSTGCEKRADCAIYYLNNDDDKMHQLENFEHYGSCSFSDEGKVEDCWCGKRGDYKMFEPTTKKISADKLVEKFYKADIDILDEDGNFRSTCDVLTDIANKWSL